MEKISCKTCYYLTENQKRKLSPNKTLCNSCAECPYTANLIKNKMTEKRHNKIKNNKHLLNIETYTDNIKAIKNYNPAKNKTDIHCKSSKKQLSKVVRRQANKRIRRNFDIGCGGDYKKVYDLGRNS